MTSERQNLKQYYKSIDNKMDFVRRVAGRCNLCTGAVLKWCFGDGKTKNETFISILSEESGIPIENLFSNNERG